MSSSTKNSILIRLPKEHVEKLNVIRDYLSAKGYQSGSTGVGTVKYLIDQEIMRQLSK